MLSSRRASVEQPAQGVAGQRCGILPALPEHGLDIADGGPSDRQLDVVPWRAIAVDGGHRLGLLVAQVAFVVTASVAEVDSADEGDVALGAIAVPQDDELLVV